ncbi:MAG: deoxyribonuclease V [Dehalococcoidia bacterium]
MVRAKHLHAWQVPPSEGFSIQRKLAEKVVSEGDMRKVRLVAGVDVSAPRAQDIVRAAIVVLSYPELEPVESRLAERPVELPYIPGLLSFREAPVILEACEKLASVPDLMLVDGQGRAHPRRLGLASHLGVLLDMPTVGCAKSRLCGEHGPVGPERGEWVELVDGGEIIGAVLRTRTDVKPLYISVGHRISLGAAVEWVLNCGTGYRLPEPTRLAHQVAGGKYLH